MAVLLRLTAEAYLLHDPAAGTPRERWQRFLALHEAARRSAAARAASTTSKPSSRPAWPAPSAAASQRLGWRHDPWPCFSKPRNVMAAIPVIHESSSFGNRHSRIALRETLPSQTRLVVGPFAVPTSRISNLKF
jgi:hypothetical protein